MTIRVHPVSRIALGVLASLAVVATCGRDAGSTTSGSGGTATTAAAPTTSSTEADGGPPAEACSAAPLDEDAGEPEGLPSAVAMMRKEIVKAAVRCDFELLEALALRGDGTFQYSYGQEGPSGSAEFWRRSEAAGEPVTAVLVRLLQLTPRERRPSDDEGPGTGSGVATWTWPRADTERPTQSEWDEVDAVYPGTEDDRYRRDGRYVGHRVGITATGDWVYFVAGD